MIIKMENENRFFSQADVKAYALAEDGGLIYNPLTEEGKINHTIQKYQNASLSEGTIEIGNAKLHYAVPTNMTAYDSVPLQYSLECPDHQQVLHLSVTAFEEQGRRAKEPSFDLNLPGTVDVDYTYLGYITGKVKEDVHPSLEADFADQIGTEFPGWELSALCCSGDLPVADRIWFRFRYRNTGNTILDGDGNGTFMFEPVLLRKNEQGEYLPYAVPSNLFYRIFDTVYPGEEGELYLTFGAYPGYPAKAGPLEPGEYRIRLSGICRSEEKEPDFARVVWSGTAATVSAFDFTITETGHEITPAPVRKETVLQPNRNGWLHQYEEFMSSFVTSSRRSADTEAGVLMIQPAPWSECLVLRLMRGDEQRVAEICLPITVESDSLSVSLNPNHTGFVRWADGTRRPAVATQSMTDMRGGGALTPFASENIINELLDMQQAGINLITTTVAFSMELGSPEPYKRGGARDAFKFTADAMRVMGFPMEGLISYPYTSGATQALASARLHHTVKATKGIGDPALIEAGSQAALYEYLRYGDNYWCLGDGKVPLCIEDTRGWIRYDQHNRYPEGEASLQNFRLYLKNKYRTVDEMNAAWKTEFSSFDAVDPEADGEAGAFGHQYEYRKDGAVFRDYNAAMWDWDCFRTIQRREHYQKILEFIRPYIPQAGICLRTEGANWLVDGISPQSKNPKYRHVVYSQRHNAMLPEQLCQDGGIAVHSDYLTLPYTPSEAAELTRLSTEQGIMTLHMPQFNRMRDIAINERYGSEAYQTSYQLKSPMKGAYINTVTAVYPYFKAVYENGGIPGILWQDYLCDGYVTSTQFKELCFFREKLDEMLETPEGKDWANTASTESDDFRMGALKKWSYSPEYVRNEISRVEHTARTHKYTDQENRHSRKG